MNAGMKSWIAPIYLFACLLLGGSSLGGWHNSLLQLVAIGIIGLAWLQPNSRNAFRRERQLRWLMAGLICWIGAQLIPLPPGVWQHIPGRTMVGEGDALLGFGAVWRPISLSPPDTWATLTTLLPPMAMFVAVLKFGRDGERRLFAAVAAAAALGLVLGLLQIGSGAAHASELYLYPRSNVGVATGFFANGNHMAALLLCVLPFAAASAEHATGKLAAGQRYWIALGASAGLAAMAAAGLVLNGSLFGLMMLVPVIVASVMVAFRHFIGRAVRTALMLGSVLIIAVGLAVGGGNLRESNMVGAAASIETRAAIASSSASLLREHFLTGTGAGTFERIYPTVENPETVDRFYVNHAHNDYLEWMIEGGLPGAFLMIGFLLWWGRTSVQMFNDSRATGFARAGAIISAILLAHSLVDFPLRSPALAALFAAAIAMLVASRRLPKERKELRPSRHLTLG